jgi:hypothetical protein
MSWAIIIIFVILLIILIVSLYYATQASANIPDIRSSDTNLGQAYTYITWTVTVLWITIGLTVLGLIALFFFSGGAVLSFGKWILYLLLIVLIIAIIVVAVMSSLCAYYINQSTNNTLAAKAYNYAIIAAVTAAVSLALLIIGYAVIWYLRTPKEEVIIEEPIPSGYFPSGYDPYSFDPTIVVLDQPMAGLPPPPLPPRPAATIGSPPPLPARGPGY